jgi:integrase
MPRLTAAALANAKPGDILRDDQVPGLHARVTNKGATFYLYFRTRAREERRPKIGDYGVFTIQQARELGRAWLVQNAQGQAVKPKLTAREKLTITDLHERWQQEHKPKLKPASAKAFEYYWDRHILPKLGRVRVVALERSDIMGMLDSVPGKTARNRVQSVISKALSLAEQWEWRPAQSNPCRTISRNKENKRTRYLTQDELQRFGEVLARWHSYKTEHRKAANFFMLLLLTGARKNEIAKARWEWVDFDRAMLCLPDSKTGRKNIPLSKRALEVLRSMLEGDPKGEWLFPGRKRGKPIHNFQTAWISILREAKLENFRIHDLRHTFASIAISYGMGIKQVGEMLGHKDPTCTHRYAHLMEHKALEYADVIGGRIQQLMVPTPSFGAKAFANAGELRVVDQDLLPGQVAVAG